MMTMTVMSERDKDLNTSQQRSPEGNVGYHFQARGTSLYTVEEHASCHVDEHHHDQPEHRARQNNADLFDSV